MRLKLVLVYTLLLYLFFIPGIAVSKQIRYAALADIVIQRGAIIIILLLVFVHLFFKKEDYFKLYLPLSVPLLLIFATACLSLIGNTITLIGFIIGLLDYLRYPFFAIAIIGMPIKKYENMIWVFFLFTSIQIPVLILQYFLSGSVGDRNSGTMGYGTQGQLAAIVIYWFYAICIQSTSIFKKLLTFILMWAAAYAGDIAILYVAPFAVIILVYIIKRKYKSLLISFLTVFVVFSVIVSFVYPILKERPFAFGRAAAVILHPNNDTELFISGNGRLANNIISFHLVLRDWRNIINGMGVNIFYKGQAGIVSGNPLANSKTLYNNIRNDPYYRDDYELGPSQYMRVFGETGILGLFAHICLLISVWLISNKFRQYITSDKEHRMYLTFRGIFLFYAVFLTVYTDTWRIDFTALPVWIYVSMMITVILQRSKKITPVPQIAPASEQHGDRRPDATMLQAPS